VPPGISNARVVVRAPILRADWLVAAGPIAARPVGEGAIDIFHAHAGVLVAAEAWAPRAALRIALSKAFESIVYWLTSTGDRITVCDIWRWGFWRYAALQAGKATLRIHEPRSTAFFTAGCITCQRWFALIDTAHRVAFPFVFPSWQRLLRALPEVDDELLNAAGSKAKAHNYRVDEHIAALVVAVKLRGFCDGGSVPRCF
jgi:hypothetical protein